MLHTLQQVSYRPRLCSDKQQKDENISINQNLNELKLSVRMESRSERQELSLGLGMIKHHGDAPGNATEDIA